MTYIRNLSLAALLLSGLLFAQSSSAACSVTNSNNANMSMSIDQHIELGKLTTPDSTPSAATINTDDSRTLPSELSINSKNQSTHGDNYSAALITISGEPDCKFEIVLSAINPKLSNIRLTGVGSTLLNSPFSGAVGTLNSTGTAQVKIGATISLSPTETTNSLKSSFTVTANFVL